MKKMMIAAGAGVFALCSMASADALLLLNQDADEKTTSPQEEAEAACPWYMAGTLGTSIALDSDIKDSNGASFKFKAGVGFNIGVGYAFNKYFAVEIRSGYLWNSLDSVPSYDFGPPGSFKSTVNGGDGNLYQVPLTADLVVSIPISDNFTIGLLGGIGMQWTKFKVSNIGLTRANVDVGTLGFNSDSVAFRYNFGLRFAHQIAHNVRVGGGFLFSGTTEVKLGKGTYAFNAGGSTEGDVDVNLRRILNISIGAGVSISF